MFDRKNGIGGGLRPGMIEYEDKPAMKLMTGKIDSSEKMISAIRHYGIIPFFHNRIPGWSIEELTDPEFWFDSSDNLGPWDWKIDVLHEGDIAYGKFLDGKAAFATLEWYRHLMNWRRSLPKYRLPLGEKLPLRTGNDRLMWLLSPIAFKAILDDGAMETAALRSFCGSMVTTAQLRKLPQHYRLMVQPVVRKNIMDSVMSYLEMGTWTVVGDIKRIYRGPNLEYKGWQRCSFTTPEALFMLEGLAGIAGASGLGNCAGTGSDQRLFEPKPQDVPFWAKIQEGGENEKPVESLSPEASRQALVNHVLDFFPDASEALGKII